ncbi:type II toxin-antitoxin system RelE/ParE family toxin [Sinorhizobium fredii]|uniref:Putative plasmid stabilization system protein n=1 Tax=Sinorhizobium fredii (strain HH103) TaxID=1117943 RepID=A0A0A8WK71_SINF1|nr:type II toxin-antitoxin system RelE/ParE family toxin [Sinorhizobium fredii]CEL26584.1 putative plasmid stabilization system protein [Sinorhizobium fredii HH103]
MAKYILSPRAEEDLREIWRSIAPDNERAADALLRRILDKAELAADHPHMGPSRPELSPTARILIEGRYIAIYEPMPYGIFVVAVVYGPRDPDAWL